MMNVEIGFIKVKAKAEYNSLCVRTQLACVHTHYLRSIAVTIEDASPDEGKNRGLNR
jgi:hypothetical protein